MRVLKVLRLGLGSLPLLCICGCASSQPYTSPGIQRVERTLITKQFYWERGKDPERFSDEQIQHLFARAPQVDFGDGERSELYSSELVWALAAAGDRHYAELLSRQSVDIQQRVLQFIQDLWKYHGMHYPLTESLSR